MTMSLSRLDGTAVCPVSSISLRVAGREPQDIPAAYVPPARGGDVAVFVVPGEAVIQRWDAYVLSTASERLLIVTISHIGPVDTLGTKSVEASIEPESPTSRGSLPPP